jgi:TRAP-type C4-dicarboxylate transport system permease small subunit
VLRRNEHFRVDIFTNGTSGIKKKILDILDFIFIAIFVIVLIVPGFEFAMMGLQRVSNPSGFPLIFATACIPLGAIFMAYYLVERLILKIADVEIGPKDDLNKVVNI